MANWDQMQNAYSCIPLIIQLQMAYMFADSLRKIWAHLCVGRPAERQSSQIRKLISIKQFKNSLFDKLLNIDTNGCGKIKTLFLLF